MPSSSQNKKVCPACGYENDLTRVFCHNCMAKLPEGPSSAAPSIISPIGPNSLILQKKLAEHRIRLLRAKLLRNFLTKSLRLIVLALIAVIVYFVIQPPINFAVSNLNQDLANQVKIKLFDTNKRGISLNQEEINNYILTKIDNQEDLYNFETFFIQFSNSPDTFQFFYILRFPLFPIFLGTTYELKVKNSIESDRKYTILPTSTSIGKLKNPFFSAFFSNFWMNRFSKIFDSEIKRIQSAKEIKIENREVKFLF